jgi:hypothetical protein
MGYYWKDIIGTLHLKQRVRCWIMFLNTVCSNGKKHIYFTQPDG